MTRTGKVPEPVSNYIAPVIPRKNPPKTAFFRNPKVRLRVGWGFFAVASSSLFWGCGGEKQEGTVLAQVDKAALTLEEVRQTFPAAYEQILTRDQYLDFIKRWIDDEVIFQQALAEGLDKDPAVAERLRQLRRKVVIEEYLAREDSSGEFQPDESTLARYYEMHKDEFRRSAPEFRMAHIRVETLKEALALRGQADRGDFLKVAAENSLDPTAESFTSIPYRKAAELPTCLAELALDAKLGRLLGPVSCPDGVYLAKITEKVEEGSQIPFNDAKEEIAGILLMARRNKLREARIDRFKEGVAITYNLSQIPGLDVPPEAAAAPSAATPTSGDPRGGVPSRARPAPEAAKPKPPAPRPEPRREPDPPPPKPEPMPPPVSTPQEPDPGPSDPQGSSPVRPGPAHADAAVAAEPFAATETPVQESPDSPATPQE